MKLRYFYRVDPQGKPIPGSNIKRKSKPIQGKWAEIKNVCCDPVDIACTCGFRYFIQITTNGNPIDYTLMRRKHKPVTDTHVKYMEINPNLCCGDCRDVTITTNAVSDISASNETYNYTFCNVFATLNAEGTSPDNAILIAEQLNDLLDADGNAVTGVRGTFTANVNGTITFVGAVCDCATPELLEELQETTITSDPLTAIGADEEYTYNFCTFSVVYGVEGTAAETADAVAALLNAEIDVPGSNVVGTFTGNGDGTITFVGTVTECADPHVTEELNP